MFIVLGVSGNTGSVVAQTLLEQKKPVRVVVRDAAKGEAWKQKGAAVAVADVTDEAALARAFQGATGVYALLPPDLKAVDTIARLRGIADVIAGAAKAAKVPHLVLLSSIAAQHETGTGPIKSAHYAEKVLRAAGVTSTFVRAAYFMDNHLNVLPLIKTQGVLPVFADPSYPFAQVSTRDIGLTAAKALLEGAKETQIIELSGPREYSINDVAQAFSTALGRPVNAVLAPLDQLVPTFISMGASESIALQMREMYEGMGVGKIAWEGGNARAVRGTVDLDTFVKSALR
jgi:uncharacterized protein YbjT (DUF2867 family)